ncbi:MAG: DUF6775 family putative metallopeptidase, partial [Candidatus Hydrothermarchaeaceae archaeon]
RDVTGLDVVVDGHFFDRWKARESTAGELAALLVKDFTEEGALNRKPSREDVSLEEEYLADGGPLPFDVEHVYEGFGFTGILNSLIRPKKEEYHLVFTSRMLSTWERDRYHGRAIICGLPLSIVSTTGMVEAPARPKEYYAKLLAMQRVRDTGLWTPDEVDFEAELRREFADRILDYDERLTEAAMGYALQTVSFFLTYDAFCPDPNCRLYNAHTQEELIHAQLESGKICKTHGRILGSR